MLFFKTFNFQDWDWFNGRNFCRDRCMDLVSFDTRGEFEMFAEIMKRGNYVYFSDRQHNLEFEKFSLFGNTIILPCFVH